MSSYNDDPDDVGTMGSPEPAVRDPELSIRRTPPPRPPNPLDPTYLHGSSPRRIPVSATGRNIALGLAAVALGVALVAFAGFAAHAIWYALHLGWQLANG